MKENYIYPVKLKKEGTVFRVIIPNFPEHMTEAETEEKAIVAAQEILALCIANIEDCNQEFPDPIKQSQIVLEEDEKLVYVHVWMPYFRNAQQTIYVKKTLTIPKWLDEMAKANQLNFSATLVKGLKRELGIGE